MFNIKRILLLTAALILLSGLFSVNAFSVSETTEKVTEATEYQKGMSYSVDGVEYLIEENGTVTVKGAALNGVPEKVEIISKLGDYTVTSIGCGAFYKCKAVKEVVIPETVTLIDRLAFEYSGLTDIEIRGKNVDISTRFRNTPLWKDNIANDMNILFVSGYAIDAFSRGEIVLGEDIVGISKDCFRYGSGPVTKITILNPDCHIFAEDGALPPNAVVYGYNGSTAQQYALNHGYRFFLICKCENTAFIPETESYCNGTIGYSDGYWCDNCKIYASGGLIDTSFEHKDTNGDNICDLCNNGTDSEITDCGKCGDEAVWTLNDDGILRISGTSGVYSYSANEREPWYNQRNKIRSFIAEEGIKSLQGISFEGYENLESAEMADTVLYLPKSFRDCTSLNNVKLSSNIRKIPSNCFRGCTSLKSIFIPQNVIEIDNCAFLNCTNLKDIDFETGYLSLQSNAFCGTAAYNAPDNIKDGFLYIDNCLIAEITPGATTLVLAKDITSIASGWWYTSDSEVTEITVYNYNCAFPNDTGALPGGAHFNGYVGSTAWFYSNKDFVELEPHTHTEVIDIPAVAPTETEPGYTHFSHCSVCGETVSTRRLVSHEEYSILIADGIVTARKTDEATAESDGENIVITFAVRNDVCTSDIKQTVIYKVGEVKLSASEFIYNGKLQKPDVTVKDSKGTHLTEGRDYKVTYSANSKYCGEYSVRVDYIGNYAGGKTLYYKIIIEAVSPEVFSFSDESICLCWKQGHPDLVYRVYRADSSGNLIAIADTKNAYYEIDSLSSGTEYRFFVRAYMTDGDGKTYWGAKGEILTCETDSASKNHGIIDFLKNFFAKFRYIIQLLLLLNNTEGGI